MAKLRQQLISKPTGRVTRTQKVAQRQLEEREEKKFQQLKARAETVREKEFAGLTNLDEYEEKYKTLDPVIQPFFQKPEVLRQEKAERIENTKSQVDQKIQEAEQKKIEAQERFKREEQRYEEKRDRLRDRRDRYSSERYSDKVDDLKEDLNDDEDKLDERLAYYNGLIKGYNQSKGQLNQGKDIDINNIVNYADDVGDYQRNREEARNENRKAKRQQEAKIEDLLERGYKPQLIQKSFKGKPTGNEISFYNPETKDYAKFKLDLGKKSVKGLKKSELGRVQTTQQIELAGKKFDFKTYQQLYVTPSGKLATQFRTFDVKESDYLQPETKPKTTRTTPPPIQVDLDADRTRPGEIYSAELGAFIKAPYGLGAGGTGIIRPPTPAERIKIESAQRRGDKLGFQIIKTPQLALGGIFKVPLSPELKEARLPPLIRASGELFEMEQDVKEYEVMAKDLNKLNERYEAGEIEYGEYKARYDATYDPKLEGRVKRYQTYTSLRQDIGASDLSPVARGGAQFTIEAVSVLPYLTGGGRVVLGGLQALEGGYRFGEAETKAEERKALTQVGLGTFVASTGFKPVSAGIGKVTGALPKGVQIGLGAGLVGGLGVGTGYQIYKETGDIASAIGGGLGAVTPLVVTFGVQRYQQSKIQKENLKRQQINYLKEKKFEALKVAQKRIDAGQGQRSYKEVGVGKKFLTTSQQKALAKEYAKATGTDVDDALRLVKERSIYQQQIKIRSDAPSYQRAIDFVKTGKAKTGSNVLTYKRYGILETTKTGDKARTFALEFNLRGSKVSRVGAKVTVAEGDFGTTQVLKKAYQRQGLPPEFRSKELLVTKADKVKVAQKGDVKLKYSETETRLIKQYSGKNLLKQQRVSFDEIYKGKPTGDKIIIKDPSKVVRPEDLYKISGKEAGKLYFKNIRAEAPVYRELVPGVKVKDPTGYRFANIGAGRGDLPTKIGFMKYGISKQPTIKFKPTKAKVDIGTSGRSDLKNIITDLSSKNQQVQVQQTQQLTTKQVAEQITKSIVDIKTTPQVRTEPMISPKTSTDLATLGASGNALQELNKDLQAYSGKTILKEKIKQKQRDDQTTKQLQELGIAQLNVLDVKQAIDQQTGQATLQQQKLDLSLVSPTIQTPPIIPKPFITPIPIKPGSQVPIPLLISLLEGRRRKKRRGYIPGIEKYAYLPDFTSRALGLAPEVITPKQARQKLRQTITGLELRRGVIIQ